jgi:hypothetical protein
MAIFNKDPQGSNDPSYLGLAGSERTTGGVPSIDKASGLSPSSVAAAPHRPSNIVSDYKGDATAGKLFQDIGEGFGNLGKVVDYVLKDHIDKDLQKDIDAVRTEHGVDGAVKVVNDDNEIYTAHSTVPDAVNRLGNRVEGLTAARRDGKLTESYYNSQLQAIVVQTRDKYPGYRDYIDEKVSSITGITPANALRKSLLADVDALAKRNQSKADKLDSWEQRQDVLPRLPPDYFQRKASGNPYSETEAKVIVQRSLSREHDTKLKRDQIADEDAQGKADATRVERVFVQQANDFVQQVLSSAQTKEFQQKLVAAQQSGKPIDAKDLQAFRAQMGVLNAQLINGLQQISLRPFNPDRPDRNYKTVINDPTKTDKVINDALISFNNIKDQMENGQWGLVNVNTNMIKASDDAASAAIIQKYPVMQAMKIINDRGGQIALNAALMDSENSLLKPLQKAMKDINASLVISGQHPNETWHSQLSRMKEANGGGTPTGAQMKGNIEAIVKTALNPEADAASATSAVQFLYKPENLSFLNEFKNTTQQVKVFGRLTSPEMTKKVKELSERDPALWNNYVNWATHSARAVFKSEIDQVQKENKSVSAYNDYTFDPKSFQVIATPRKRDPKDFQATKLAEAEAGSAQRLNSLLLNLKPIYQQAGSEVMSEFGKAIGIDATVPKESFLRKIGESISDWVGNEVDSLRDKGDVMKENQKSQKKSESVTPGKLSFDSTDRELAQPLIDLVGKAEAKSYNTVSGGQEFPITSMTVADAAAFGDWRRKSKRAESSAVGMPQFLKETIDSLIADGTVKPDDIMNEETQDKMLIALAKRRGYDDFKAGKISKEKFVNELAKEWAGLPNMTGKSHHHGVGSNRATVRLPDVFAALEKL